MSLGWRDDLRYHGGSLRKELAAIEALEQDMRDFARAAEPRPAPMLAGVKRAYVHVSGHLPPALRVGFLLPGATYPAHLRFTRLYAPTGSAMSQVGLAVRIVVGPNASHDLVMANAERYYARDGLEAMATLRACTGRRGLAAQLALVRALGLRRGLVVAEALRTQARVPVHSLASETYWSQTPYAFGPTALRFHAAPLAPKPAAAARTRPDLGAEFANRLKREGLRFDLRAQRYLDATRTPLNDCSQFWLAPHETIAELVIPSQELTAEDLAFVAALNINPFNVASPEFEPLGSVNRARARAHAVSNAIQRAERA